MTTILQAVETMIALAHILAINGAVAEVLLSQLSLTDSLWRTLLSSVLLCGFIAQIF